MHINAKKRFALDSKSITASLHTLMQSMDENLSARDNSSVTSAHANLV